MRLRNVKNKKEILNGSKLLVRTPLEYKGKWQSIFNNNNEIHIEIGMGKGDFIINMAKLYPNINFIGIEKYDSILAKAVQKIELEEYSNLKLIRMDACDINDVFLSEISKIYLNFSDPWPKKRHSDRRLTSHIFLDKYSKVFKDNQVIEMKTDNNLLFEYSLVSLSSYGYIFNEVYIDLHNSDKKDNVVTEYESKFAKLGIKYVNATKSIK